MSMFHRVRVRVRVRVTLEEATDEHVPSARPEVGDGAGSQQWSVKHQLRSEADHGEHSREGAREEAEEEIDGPHLDVQARPVEEQAVRISILTRGAALSGVCALV